MNMSSKVIYGVVIVIFIAWWLLSNSSELRRRDLPQRGYLVGMAHNLEYCLEQYAKDHQGKYPEGQSSTEVFQHLIDEHYLDDPSILCSAYAAGLPGKVPLSGSRLKPENVCWDITCCVDSSAPASLPVVFSTGYKITYQPGTRAIPLYQIPAPPRTWLECMYFYLPLKPFISVCYKDNSARSLRADDDGSIPNFIPADFDPRGKTYRQLTP
jgi:hypothetical protein